LADASMAPIVIFRRGFVKKKIMRPSFPTNVTLPYVLKFVNLGFDQKAY